MVPVVIVAVKAVLLPRIVGLLLVALSPLIGESVLVSVKLADAVAPRVVAVTL